jgi:hypothetical protein
MTPDPRATPPSASTTESRTTRALDLSADEVDLIRIALRLLASTLGREEADELAEALALIRRLDAES